MRALITTDKSITNDSLIEGYGKIQKVLGVLPITYIPPYNEVSLESREIISNYFRIISGEQGIIKEGEKIAEIGYTEKREAKNEKAWKSGYSSGSFQAGS
ncbi:MAG: hypothetical protein UU80_C0013G0038 [candidate division WWE3 bacterium GW2011_GWA1_41_8]|uniref:Uncharacterized protein n=1 Tax=candidate division WWE3 bacterium GW2011_GWA1_41_8 TaxID=1619103 RepID=A0A0G0XB20_UNCKA|nr:MAG: hypothetical protein UU80_C0013G0038 [candidate division WWE3 bacterium GW2011_GWA1_41_8]